MKFRKVANSDLVVSELTLGTVEFGAKTNEDMAGKLVAEARESGITVFDTSDNYNAGASESMLGRVLSGSRKEVILSSKFTGSSTPFKADGSYSAVIRACEDSLVRLKTDYIDLYTMHHPDPETPIAETLAALNQLVKQGKVRYIACSNFSGWQVAEAAHVSAASRLPSFIANQVEWNLLKRHAEREVLPACRDYKVDIMPFYPIASGLLSGKYRSEEDFPKDSRLAKHSFYRRVASDVNLRKVAVLADFCEQNSMTMMELAIGWLLSFRQVSSVLVGATNPAQLKESIASCGRLLGDEEKIAVINLLEECSNAGEIPFNDKPIY
jgi:aryl-alcohol dehydrogenase-like predicted oxidoreductase